ncbi:MAG: squalene/phytoene synthase family protein [Pirellulaceae bacterium]|nr:squalene/phytoene synthase family protein [Pirellulaceae bacterium]
MNDLIAASYAQCRRIARAAASNFAWAFWLLPADQRRGMEALYAFARLTDDLADGPLPLADKRQALASWEGDLTEALAGRQASAIWPALVDAVRRFEIDPQYLRQIVHGAQMDLDHAGFETFADLRHYCLHVASAVGLACLAIWGSRDERAIGPATDCGIAFQLTNILRDLKEDRELGRRYLPREDLARFPDELELLRFEIARARQLYDSASETARYLPAPGRRMFRLMHATYRDLLRQMERDPRVVLQRRIRLSRPRKAWLALRSVLT